MLELTLRLVFSLAAVIGLLLLLAKFSSKRFQGRSGAAVQVLHRQALSRSANVSVVTVGERVLLLGVTEQQVSLLTELDPSELPEPEPEAEPDTAAGDPAGVVQAVKSLSLPKLARPAKATKASASPTPKQAQRSGNPAVRAGAAKSGTGLEGSVLSPQTWREAWSAANRRAS